MSGNVQYVVRDRSSDKKYFTQTPQLVWAKCDNPYEFMLWHVVKMIASDDGECYVSTPDLARLCMMGVGTVSRARKALLDKGLLRGKLILHHNTKVWHLEVPDLWPENIRWREEHHSLKDRISLKEPRTRAQREALSPVECAPEGGTLSRGESALSRGETKKNQEVEPKNPAQAQELQSPLPPAPVSPSEQDKDNGPVQDETPNALRAFFPEGGVTSARQTTPRTAEEHAQSVATASARGHARRAASNNNITGLPSFEAALKRYGDEAPHLRALQAEIDSNFALMPDWNDKSAVKGWVIGLRKLLIASQSDVDIVIAAGKQLRAGGITLCSPHTMVNTARGLAAERATACGSPEVQARKEYR